MDFDVPSLPAQATSDFSDHASFTSFRSFENDLFQLLKTDTAFSGLRCWNPECKGSREALQNSGGAGNATQGGFQVLAIKCRGTLGQDGCEKKSNLSKLLKANADLQQLSDQHTKALQYFNTQGIQQGYNKANPQQPVKSIKTMKLAHQNPKLLTKARHLQPTPTQLFYH
jgi:hypothetical protein